jgi:hypothetical protein
MSPRLIRRWLGWGFTDTHLPLESTYNPGYPNVDKIVKKDESECGGVVNINYDLLSLLFFTVESFLGR